jgi:tetratricopeptide (TPR) repeat protein
MRLPYLALFCAFAIGFSWSSASATQFGRAGGMGGPQLPRAKVNWESANGALSKELDTNDIGALAKRVRVAPVPQDAAGWLRRLALLVRADYRQDTLGMLTSRPRFLTRTLDWGLSDPAGTAVKYRFPQLALRLCELFPEESYRPEVIASVLATLPAARIDSWLAKEGLERRPEWFTANLQRKAHQGTEGPLMAAEQKRLRAHPDDLDGLDRYLAAVRICRDERRPYDTNWLSTFCRPRLSVASFIFAERLHAVGADPVPLYQRSLETPFIPSDAVWYRDYERRMRFAFFGGDPAVTERQLRDWTMMALMKVYQSRGEHAKAQALLETLTARNKNGLPDPYQAFGAGQIQGGSGARVIEQRVLAAEKKDDNQNAPEYWLERGLYYSGRKEDSAAVQAFEKALKLAPIPAVGGPISPRWDIVQAYGRHLWLRNIDRPTDMLALINRELDVASPASYYAEALFQSLANYRSEALPTIDPADPRLWAFLAAQPDWSHLVVLLKTLLIDTQPPQQDRVMKQVAALTKGASTSRAYALGEMEGLWGDPQRAISVLEEALPRATTEQESWQLYSNLWRARQRLNDWPGMEALLRKYPLAGSRIEIANAAAAGGANREAMRIFQKWLNQDRRRFAEFPAKSNADLMQLLRSYYRALRIEEPRCATPALAAKMLTPPGP